MRRVSGPSSWILAAVASLAGCTEAPSPAPADLAETEVCLAALRYLIGGSDVDTSAQYSLSVTVASGEPRPGTVEASREACRRAGLQLRDPGDPGCPRLVVRIERLTADLAEVRIGIATAPGAGRGSILRLRRHGDRIAIEPLSHWRM